MLGALLYAVLLLFGAVWMLHDLGVPRFLVLVLVAPPFVYFAAMPFFMVLAVGAWVIGGGFGP